MAGDQERGFPYMPVYWKDWLTGEGTIPMTTEQEGAFFRLLLHSWGMTPPCTLPNDDRALAQMTKLSVARWRSIGGIVRAQFEVVDGRLRNPKQFEVYAELVEHRNRRASAGSRGGNARAMLKQTPSKRRSNAQTESCPASASASASASEAIASSDTVDLHFERFWQTYPKRAGGNPRRDALSAFRQRIREGATVDEIMAGVQRYAAYCLATERVGTEFVMQAKRFVGPARPYAEDWGLPKQQHGTNQQFNYDNATTDFKGWTA